MDAMDAEKTNPAYVISKEGRWSPRPIRPSRAATRKSIVVFPCCTARLGEDGTIQGCSELASCVCRRRCAGSSVSMDKEVMKRLAKRNAFAGGGLSNSARARRAAMWKRSAANGLVRSFVNRPSGIFGRCFEGADCAELKKPPWKGSSYDRNGDRGARHHRARV